MNNSRSEIDFVYYQTLFFVFFGRRNSFFFLLESQLRLHLYIIFYIYTRLANPNMTQFFLTPYIIPILGLNRPVSRDYVGRSAEGTETVDRMNVGLKVSSLASFFYPDHLFHSSFTIHCNRLCSLWYPVQHIEYQPATFAAL